jgi:hypothetical protein
MSKRKAQEPLSKKNYSIESTNNKIGRFENMKVLKRNGT